MNRFESDLVLDLALRRISKDEFLKRFRPNDDREHLISVLLKEAIAAQSSDDVEFTLITGFGALKFQDENIEDLILLIFEDWHMSHEDIVSALDELNSPISTDALFHAVN